MKGILEGYQGVLPHQKYPAAFLNIEINPELIDINIHPKKEEIKFLNPGVAQQTIATIIKEALNNFISQKISTNTKRTMPISQEEIEIDVFKEENSSNFSESTFKAAPRNPLNTIFKSPFTSDIKIEEIPATPTIKENTQPIISPKISQLQINQTLIEESIFTIIGQFNKTYIIIEQNNELILIDQHAAHERIIYERLKIQGEIPSVQLMFPHIIKMPASMVQKILVQTHLLSEHGIIIDQLSDCEIIITATPIGILTSAVQEIIMMISDLLEAEVEIANLQINEKIIIAKACKTACKAGDSLDISQMQNLIKELMKTPDRFSCPHGRPTMYPMALKEIEKHFKRNYVGTKEKNMSNF